MKKRRIVSYIVLIIIASLFMLSSCTSISLELKNQMIEYYSCDDNYVDVKGTILDVTIFPEGDVLISIDQSEREALTDSYTLPKKSVQVLLNNGFEFEASDKTYVFTTSFAYWYNGFDYPIISIKEYGSDIIYLDYQSGKENYLSDLEAIKAIPL